MQSAHEPRLARVAAMIADPARSRMLAYLLSGAWASAGELARVASVTPATASGHLRRLLDAGMLASSARGRHRYFRLADEDVAHALESLALVAERHEHDRVWEQPARRKLRFARCCYGHLAGTLGVALYDTMMREHALAANGDGFALTGDGERWLDALGLQAAVPTSKRRYAYACLDWSERRDHLAGQLADALLDQLLERRWLRKPSGRVVELTSAGRAVFLPHLAIEATA